MCSSDLLRLFPPSPINVRAANTDCELGGYRLKSGQRLLLMIYAMHRRPDVWRDPDLFDPNRFLSGSVPSHAWMPFGAGPQVCIASQFALAELSIIVSRLVSRLEFSPIDPDPELSLQITTRSKTGLNVVTRLRQGSEP